MRRRLVAGLGLALTLVIVVPLPAQESDESGQDDLIRADDLVTQPEEPAEEGEPQSGEDAQAAGETAIEDHEIEGTVEVEPEKPKTEFTIPVAAEHGGGQINGKADQIQRQPDGTTVTLLGGVEISYRRLKIQADQIDVDLETREVAAVGNVILDEGPNRYGATRIDFDLDTETGRMENATASLVPDVYFRGDTVEKIGDATYVVEHGMFSSCEGDVPAWSFRTGKAKVTLDGYAHATNVTFRAKKMPVIYVPYLLFPVKSKRTSGLLMPSFSTSERHGDSIGLAWYQTFGPSYDATFELETYTEDFLGYGSEFRYRPSQRSRGYLRARFIDDELNNETHYRYNLVHETRDLPLGMRALVDVVDFSDIEFFRAFDRDLGRNSRRSWRSHAYLTGAVGPQSYSLQVDERETLFANATQIQRQLPELEYRLRAVQLGSLPLYFQLESAAHYISAERQPNDPTLAETSVEYGRLNLVPAFTVPIQTVPWLSLNLRAATRATWYQKSKILVGETEDPELVGQIEGDALTRVVPSVGAEIVGPSFSKVFNRGVGSFEKFKHVIEPRWSYSFSDEFEDQQKVPRFDEIDGVSERHRLTFSFVQRLLAKPKPPLEEEPDGGTDELEEDAAIVLRESGETLAEETADGEEELDIAGTTDEELATAVETSEEEIDPDERTGDALLNLRAVGAREIMSLELLQAYSFDEEQPLQILTIPAFEDQPAEILTRQTSPIQLRYRFNPSRVTSLRADASYSPLAGEMLRYSVSGTLGFDAEKRNYVGLSWNRQFVIVDNPNTGAIAGDTLSDQLGLQVGLSAWNDRLRFLAAVNLDLDPREGDPPAPELQRQRYIAEYRGPCAGLLLEFQERRRLGTLEGVFQEIRDQQFRIALSLRHIGTFLDFGFGDSSDNYSQNFSF